MNENAENEGSSPRAAPESAVPFSGTVTIFFSDIRGFTDYTEKFGDEAAYRVLREHNGIVESQIAAFGGRIVKTQGDSFMATFGGARGAILCAVAVQRALTRLSQEDSEAQIAIGIGINTGDSISDEHGDQFGSAVNLAARICEAAGKAQILVAETTRLLAGRIEPRRADGGAVDYVDRGEQRLKGFPEPKRLFEVAWNPTAIGEPAGGEEEAAAFKASVPRAIGVLTRVLGVIHLDDPAFPPLLECQAKASELRLALSRAGTDRRGSTAKEVGDWLRPFENLLTLMRERDTLAEERWAQLDAAVARAFGRPLVNAVARGRLASAASTATAEKPPTGGTAKQPPPPTVEPRSFAAALAPPPLDPRGAAIRWWAGAYAAWSQWKPSGIAWAHALRAEVEKYPYLLSVNIRAAADHDDGQLAGGYFLLLEHLENQSPALMRTALDRAIETANGLEPRVLGPQLYQLLVERGRLRDTYASFVRDVIQVAIPNPGLWADWGVVETDETTTVISRPPPTVGAIDEQVEQITDPQERANDRVFDLTLQPMTTRFFYMKIPEKLKTPRDAELRLTADGQPSGRAWHWTLKDSLTGRSDPKLLPVAGIPLAGLGRDPISLWVAVFNPDPDEVVSYELILSAKQARPAAAKWSPFTPPPPPPAARPR